MKNDSLEATDKIYKKIFNTNEPTLNLPDKFLVPKFKQSTRESIINLDGCPCDDCEKYSECANKHLACKEFDHYVKGSSKND